MSSKDGTKLLYSLKLNHGLWVSPQAVARRLNKLAKDRAEGDEAVELLEAMPFYAQRATVNALMDLGARSDIAFYKPVVVYIMDREEAFSTDETDDHSRALKEHAERFYKEHRLKELL